jgi:dihydrofolate reductase
MDTQVSVFMAMSLDGFIARPNGAIDWLPNGGSELTDGEDYGYQAFFDSVDAIALGRHTYDLVRTFGEWPYGLKPVVVLTSRAITIPDDLSDLVTVAAGSPAEIYRQLADQGLHHVYIDGGKTIQGFLQAGLINTLTISTVPILIGCGRPLFGALARDVRLALIESRSFPNGVVQSRYRVGQ